MRELLTDLVRRMDTLENESTQLEDWDGFLNQARALHERALIMRYKALERLSDQQATETPEEELPEQPIVWGTPAEHAGADVEPLEEAPTEAPAMRETEIEVEAEPEDTTPLTTEAPALDEVSATEAAPTHFSSKPPLPQGAGVSLAEKLSLQPLKSILPALGINDRVRFAGVLFNGDMAALHEACAAAEAAGSFEEARQTVMQQAQAELDWSDEEEAPYQFMQLVQRVHLQ